MRTLLTIFVVVSLSRAAAVTWTAADSANNTLWSNDANWSTASKPTSSDTAVFTSSGGSKTPNTGDLGLTNPFASIRIANTYTRAWSWNGTRAFQLSNDFIDDGITGTHYLGTGVTMNGASSLYHVGSGCAAGYSVAATTLTVNGTTGAVIDQDLGSVYYKRLNIGPAAIVTSSGAASFGITGAAADTSLKMGASSSLTLTAPLLLYLPLANGVLWSFGSGASCAGAGGVSVLTSTTPYTVPAGNFGTSNSVTFTAYASGTFNITGNLSFGTDAGKGHFVNTNSASTTIRWINASSNITAGTLQFGSSHASGSVVASYGSGTYQINIFDGTTKNTNANIDSFQTLVGYCSGNFSMGSNHTYVPGTSSWTMDSAGTLTTNGKSLYDFTFAAGAGLKDSLADSGSFHNLTLTSGKLKGLSHGGYLTGNMTLGGSDSLFGRLASPQWWTFANQATWQQTNSNAQRLLDSTQWHFVNGGSWLQDSSNNVRRVILSSANGGKKLAIQAGKTLTIRRPANGDFSGTSAAAMDSLVSSSAGNAAYLSFGVQPVDSYTYIKDIKVTGSAWICTTGCFNGGNDSNVTFLPSPVLSYSVPATISTAGGKVIIQGQYLSASGGTLTIDGSPIALTTEATTFITFTAPAHAAGTAQAIYTKLDNNKDTLTLTYGTRPFTTKTKIGVLFGQSNAQGSAPLRNVARDTAATDSALAYRKAVYTDITGTWGKCIDPFVGTAGSMGPPLSTSLVRLVRDSVALVNIGALSTNLVGYAGHKAICWGFRNADNPWDTSYLYGRAITTIVNALGDRKPDFWVWWQGETEAQYPKDSIDVYPTRFDTMQARMKLDLGLDSMPTFIVQIAIDSQLATAPYDTNYTNLRTMQYGLDRGTSTAIFGACTYPLPQTNAIHTTDVGMDTLGVRLANLISRYWSGVRSPYPHLTAVTSSDDTLIWQFNAPLYPSVTTVSGCSLDVAGTPATISQVITYGMQLKILTDATEANLSSRYMIRRLPNVSAPIYTYNRLPVLPIGVKRDVGYTDRAGRLVTNILTYWGKPGDQFTVAGSGFGASKGAGSIKFDKTTLTEIPSWTNTSISAIVPNVSSGFYDIVITPASGTPDTIAYGFKVLSSTEAANNNEFSSPSTYRQTYKMKQFYKDAFK